MRKNIVIPFKDLKISIKTVETIMGALDKDTFEMVVLETVRDIYESLLKEGETREGSGEGGDTDG